MNKQQEKELMKIARERLNRKYYNEYLRQENEKILRNSVQAAANTKNVGPIVGGTLFRAKEESPTQNTT